MLWCGFSWFFVFFFELINFLFALEWFHHTSRIRQMFLIVLIFIWIRFVISAVLMFLHIVSYRSYMYDKWVSFKYLYNWDSHIWGITTTEVWIHFVLHVHVSVRRLCAEMHVLDSKNIFGEETKHNQFVIKQNVFSWAFSLHTMFGTMLRRREQKQNEQIFVLEQQWAFMTLNICWPEFDMLPRYVERTAFYLFRDYLDRKVYEKKIRLFENVCAATK